MKYVKTRFMRILSAVSGQIHAPAAFLSRWNSPRYAVNRSLNGARSWCGRSEEIFLARAFNQTMIPRSSVPSPIHCTDYANRTPFHTLQDILLYKIIPVI